jgi:hypothetical protein
MGIYNGNLMRIFNGNTMGVSYYWMGMSWDYIPIITIIIFWGDHYYIQLLPICIYTSSTAQGGGGSFRMGNL